jgi:subtilisin family serine protease
VKRFVVLVIALLTMLALAVPTGAQEAAPDRSDRELPASVADLKLSSPITNADIASLGILDTRLVGSSGAQNVVVQLDEATVGALAAQGKSASAQKAQLKKIEKQQDAFRGKAIGLGAKELGSVQRALNAVMIEIDASALPEVAAQDGVVSVRPVIDYEMDLSETVPYIGATEVQDAGYTGEGVKVAVLDSGVDYTHASLGGPGTVHAWEKAYGQVPQSGKNKHITDRYLSQLLYPTDVVVGGYDFVGEFWVGGAGSPALEPDPDPIDIEGHGTHVADIIHAVAPDADIYAVKVCASFSTACSGVALLQAMDFALDPNGDGDTADHVDVVNMSLGALYGQPFDDDLSYAVEQASALGVLSVTAAGNAADKPYIVDSPSGAFSAFSVAQTAVPSAVQPLMEVTAPEGIAGTYAAVFQSWSVPLDIYGVAEGPLQYGDGADGNLDGCAPFAAGSLEGKVVLVDRGACNFTLKISNISQGGGVAGIIGLIAPGDPFNGGDGGDRPIDIPGFMISQALSDLLKSGLPDTYVVFDPNEGIPLVGHMVGSSARGPVMGYNTIKPDIGAPGASVSAIAGSGTDTGPFGGTSGATPMVAGASALLLDAYPNRSPAEIKSVLMNTAETDIMNVPEFFGGDLAPITRIGGGEVRVNRALDAPAAAWDSEDLTGSLSFRFHDVADATVTLTREVTVKNYEGTGITYDITPTFRFSDDAVNGAVSVSVPPTVSVPPNGMATFDVTLTIDGAALRGWSMNSGSMGANGDALTLVEYDGYLLLDDPSTDTTDDLHLAWQVLPRKAANVVPDTTELIAGSLPQLIGLDNTGVGTAQNDAYALLAISENEPEGVEGQGEPTPDIRAVGINTFPVPAGFCSEEESFIWAFAVNTWERQSHLVPVSHIIDLDIDQDGVVDATVLNRDFSAAPPGFNQIGDGRQLTWALDYNAGTASAFFFTEHATNTGNTMLYICGEQIGLTGDNMAFLGTNPVNVDMSVFAQDFYFGGPGDLVDGLTVTPLGERFYGQPSDVAGSTYDPFALAVFDFGPWPGNSDELGLMVVTNGDRGGGARGGATQETEALLFTLP